MIKKKVAGVGGLTGLGGGESSEEVIDGSSEEDSGSGDGSGDSPINDNIQLTRIPLMDDVVQSNKDVDY